MFLPYHGVQLFRDRMSHRNVKAYWTIPYGIIESGSQLLVRSRAPWLPYLTGKLPYQLRFNEMARETMNRDILRNVVRFKFSASVEKKCTSYFTVTKPCFGKF